MLFLLMGAAAKTKSRLLSPAKIRDLLTALKLSIWPPRIFKLLHTTDLSRSRCILKDFRRPRLSQG